ncbi:isoleucine--tRNA ligase, cytoplasmic-like [Ornithodoros turicata]|uniref:Isoleucine--tRNA ligase, cytoplasmic n=1 Tax=Ornithodoros turicata TaxID=34597 RepID=A0A2R5LDL7_9ACAR
MDHVPENINFPQEEASTLKFWKDVNAFQTSIKLSKGRPRFTFYDGPPFATGLPHYGHILAGTIKDIVTRFAHQSGYYVERRFGWDCHGLPVEYEIDKTLNIKGPEDVKKMGIAAYNAECRKIVMRYSSEWEKVVTRMGRWIDFENDYKTMYPSFMESVWYIFKQLYNQGFVYKGVKVMPYSTTCSTPLSNFESGQNYKEVVDPAVIVSFPLDEDPNVSMIAWTTTPWTLPSNMALCVNPKMVYVKVKDNETGKVYIMMEARLEALFKKPEDYAVLESFKGETLLGKKYDPIFPYFAKYKTQGAFKVLCDNYVTDDSGTGVVHQAPYFGEDDYRVCLANGVVTKDQEMVCPLDASGRFIEPVSDFVGLYVKDADKEILKNLKKRGRLVNQSTAKHSYPFCWRSETPLIYRAVPSWFVRVEHMTDLLLKTNAETYWVPDFVKEKRFGNWLKDAHDWAISRNRYWGTPIPIWISDDGEEIMCIGSIKELEDACGQKVTDLHRESIDHLEIPSVRGKGTLKRISEVFDCWFESGSMPYAQVHYPFEHKQELEECFPADFIAEGVDQTRGWFYTLLVLSTALFGKPPFKNLIANGLVLASDGQKMSKRKKNYPDPMEVVNKYGADALRLYLINSPVVRAENLRFREEGVRDVLKDVFLPWYNAYRFLVQNIVLFEKENNEKFEFKESTTLSSNVMDRWILSYTQSLVVFVKKEMKAYRLYTVVPRLVKFVDHLTNWYVRMNRKRLKGEGGRADCLESLETLLSVLYTMIRLMAPFTPYLTELMYQNLRHLFPETSSKEEYNSVHYLPLPEPRSELIEETVERSVSCMQTVIELGRIVRDRRTLPLKYPLRELIVIHKEQLYLDDVASLKQYVLEELNIKDLTLTTEKEKYGVLMKAEPDIKALGLRLRGESKKVGQAIRELKDVDIQKHLSGEALTVCGHQLEQGDIRVQYSFSGAHAQKLSEQYEAHSEGDLLILLDVSPDQTMLNEGLAREVINRMQKLRKKAHLVPTDPVSVYTEVTPTNHFLADIVQSHSSLIEGTLKVPVKRLPVCDSDQVIIEETQELKGASLKIVITKRKGDVISVDKANGATVPSPKKVHKETTKTPVAALGDTPVCRYVNVELTGDNNGNPTRSATVLLENPIGQHRVDLKKLHYLVQVVFDLPVTKVSLYKSKDKSGKLTALKEDDVMKLHGTTLYVNIG